MVVIVEDIEHNPSFFHVGNFEGSLGQVSVGSVFHPREVVQVGDAGKPRGPVRISRDSILSSSELFLEVK